MKIVTKIRTSFLLWKQRNCFQKPLQSPTSKYASVDAVDVSFSSAHTNQNRGCLGRYSWLAECKTADT
jgi:hypothetical protein